jgi:GNAT superfamily N-acetyltransferase
MTVAIRPASPSDARTLADLIHGAFAEYEGVLLPPSAAMRETPSGLAEELTTVYGGAIADIEDGAGRAAAGCVLFRPEGNDLYFGRLSVLPPYRNRGIAAALVAHVEAEASRRGCAGVVLGVRIALPENQRFFARLGYTEVGRHAHAGFDHDTWIEMRKGLGESR